MKRPSKVGDLLSGPAPEKKKSVMLYLPVKTYKAFQAACKKRGRTASQVIAAFMADFAAGKYDDEA